MEFKVDANNWRKIGVYSITNTINGKIYIGSTTTNFRHRYLQYKSGFLRKLDNQPVLYRAFRKHGFENFTFEVLCITDRENTLEMEQFYINKGTDYNSCLVAGSLSGFKHSKTSKTRTIIGGLHHCAKPVYQFTKDGIFIKKHLSIVDALKSLNKSKKGSSHITQSCVGNSISAFGYRWSFSDTLDDRIDLRTLPVSEEKIQRMSKPRKKDFSVNGIIATNLITNKTTAFKSVKIASNALGMLQTAIYNNLNKRSNSVMSKINKQKYRFIWDKRII